jgi:hypothetical protein
VPYNDSKPLTAATTLARPERVVANGFNDQRAVLTTSRCARSADICWARLGGRLVGSLLRRGAPYVVDEATVAQRNGPLAALCDILIVRHHDDGGAKA